jgi:hypothetical protein
LSFRPDPFLPQCKFIEFSAEPIRLTADKESLRSIRKRDGVANYLAYKPGSAEEQQALVILEWCGRTGGNDLQVE